jgi:hypothetical protein
MLVSTILWSARGESFAGPELLEEDGGGDAERDGGGGADDEDPDRSDDGGVESGGVGIARGHAPEEREVESGDPEHDDGGEQDEQRGDGDGGAGEAERDEAALDEPAAGDGLGAGVGERAGQSSYSSRKRLRIHPPAMVRASVMRKSVAPTA